MPKREKRMKPDKVPIEVLLRVRINHGVNEVTTVETQKLRLVLEDGKIIAVDTDKRLFQNVTLIELAI